MLKISKLADYATVIMGHLAQHQAESQSATEVAEATKIPVPTVSKVLKLLNEAGLVVSVRGPSGGYHLKMVPSAISVGAIIAAIDGKPAITECSQQHSGCILESSCGHRANWRKINRAVINLLNKISLAEMNAPIEEPLKFHVKEK